MLFTSVDFIFLFLPITLTVYLWLRSKNYDTAALMVLVLASMFFYGWWNPQYIVLILVSVLVNYAVIRLLDACLKYRFGILSVGVVFNLGLLGYFKYADFFIATLNDLGGSYFLLPHILLPLAISFVTFQQIAYIVDAYRGKEHTSGFLQYSLFVTFFPQLIAGPIVHHCEMIPQFFSRFSKRKIGLNIAIGISIFSIGLVKKLVFADNIALYSTPVFDAAAHDYTLTFFEAWSGSLAYTLQIYFDFSGYCDMAIGIARMFGIQLPINFSSPYKSRSIIDFWRTWHMTLSRFLRDYLYFPLGGNRKGYLRRYQNLFIVMLLGGIWHGAGWTFVFWGALHGIYLTLNHLWRDILQCFNVTKQTNSKLAILFSKSLTMLAVIIAWVFFRAENMDTAISILRSMTGQNGISLPTGVEHLLTPMPFAWMQDLGIVYSGMFYNGLANFHIGLIWIVVLILVTQFLPNTQTILQKFYPGLGDVKAADVKKKSIFKWHINMRYGMVVGIMLFFAFSTWFSVAPSEFIYFNF